jgi:CheY-like chemotaxis protein
VNCEATVSEILVRVRDLRDRAADDETLAADLDRIATAGQRMSSLVGSLDELLSEAKNEDGRRKLRHDLRTPVNQMLGYCELLQEEIEDGEDGSLLEPLAQLHGLIVTLPDHVTALVPARARTTTGPTALVPQRTHRGMVLVVDDNAANRDMLCRRLDRDGFDTICAEDGEQALAKARSSTPDVILLDIMMPVMDGNETLDRLKADADLRHIPVIMLTSLDETVSIVSCIERGAEDHLPKPFDPVLLRARLGACLEKKLLHDRERSYMTQIVAEKRRADGLLNVVIPLGVSLSATRDFNQMLASILDETCRFCGADGGILYLRDGASATLTPMLHRFDSLGVECATPPGEGSGLEATPLHPTGELLRPEAAAAVSGSAINLQDAHDCDDYDMSGVRSFDDRKSYDTRTVLAVPLRTPAEGIIGVLQLVNATHASENTIVTFSAAMQEMVVSLSLLAAVALANYSRESRLREQIRALEIEVDEAKKAREVQEITDTDYFKQLRERARALRARTAQD